MKLDRRDIQHAPDSFAATKGRNYLPVAVDVNRWPCLIVGGGKVGSRKAATLVQSGAEVTVLAPEISERLQGLVQDGKVAWVRESYRPTHLEGFRLVISATSDPSLNIRVGRDAEEEGALSCVASPGRFSNLIFPATHQQDGLTVAVHSNGRDCAESRKVRDDIARMLDGRGAPALALTVFGIKRSDLPVEILNALEEQATYDALYAIPGAQIVVLATCQRWECYILTAHPRRIIREILRIAHERTGTPLETYASAFYTKTEAAAFHHLLRVVAGLDSPLHGETDIVGQVRAAVSRAAHPKMSPAAQLFRDCLTVQKNLRSKSELSASNRSWSEATLRILEARSDHRSGHVLLVGCGRLGESVASKLLGKGATVIPFSSRADGPGVPWCAHMGLETWTLSELPDFVSDAGALVLATELPSEQRKDLGERLSENKICIVDLAGNFSGLGSPLAEKCIGLDEIGRSPLSGEEAKRFAVAERLAVEHTLRFYVQIHKAVNPPSVLRLGARGSKLSRVQIREVKRFLRILSPRISLETLFIETPGDRDRSIPLPSVTQEDFFTRDLDDAVICGDIDVALHSAKDLPASLREELTVAALTPAFAPWEALVTRDGILLTDIPSGACIGTSSARRAKRVKDLRPDLELADIRGNVPDRIAQLDAGAYDGLILAAAGLVRLGLQERIAQVFSLAEFPQEPGQGALALVTHRSNLVLRQFLQPLDLGDREGLPWA